MNSKKLPNVRNSQGNDKPSLNTSGLLNDKEDISGLNNKFTDYIDYVRSLEATNDKLTGEMQSVREKSERDMSDIKFEYGNEISSLRKALDDVTTTKSTLAFENKSLVEENDKLTTKLRNETTNTIVHKKQISELEENIHNYRKKMSEYDQLKTEHAELFLDHNSCVKELKNVRCKLAELESRVATLTDEADFYKRVSVNTKSESVANVSTERIAVPHEDIVDKTMELTQTFYHYKDELAKVYEEKIDELQRTNDKSVLRCNSLFGEVQALKRTVDELKGQIHSKNNEIATLSKRVANYSDRLNQANVDHDNFARHLTDDNASLKRDLESKIVELASVITEKIAIEKELCMFRSMLDGEQSRCNIGDVASTRKRRQGASEDDDFDVSAWSNGRLKLLIDDQYDGGYLLLMNDGAKPVNINEWRIEATAGDDGAIYTFPDRLVQPGAVLKCWSQDRTVAQDDNNVVLNVSLPLADAVSGKIYNDMDELEASFEVRKRPVKRRILKANTKHGDNEACVVM